MESSKELRLELTASEGLLLVGNVLSYESLTILCRRYPKLANKLLDLLNEIETDLSKYRTEEYL